MSTQTTAQRPEGPLDPGLTAVLANKFDFIVREMSNTLLRTGRSTVMAVGRDFSCAVVTAEDELLSSAEALPVHVFGSHLQTAAMREFHPDMREGDAFLDNDPYVANTHHADHTILVPVFYEGVHLFTAVAKAHQADTGNSIPSTYHPTAKDVYEEGAVSFPMVRVQSDYQDVAEIIRIGMRRIRVPDQWYGDYLAMLGAARIGERRLKELVAKYGVETIRAFTVEWLDYSERMARKAIEKLPAGEVVGTGAHDAFGPFEDGIPVKVIVRVDPEQGYIDVDLTDNIDSVVGGVNQSRATATNNSLTGVLNVLESGVPANSGTFRRVRVHLRENCVLGIPVHPTSCSMATTNVADRMINVTQHAFSEIGDGYGLAQGGGVTGVGAAVIGGFDPRKGNRYINQMIISSNGGPASPGEDGWLTYGAPVGAGLTYKDSIELDELRYPILFRYNRLMPDSGGAGRHRGGAASTIEYGPRFDVMTAAYNIDGHTRPAQGARGGGAGSKGAAYIVREDGTVERTANMTHVEVRPGEWLRGIHGGGGGYGDPFEREPRKVLEDYLEKYISRQAVEEVYGVVLREDENGGEPTVDEEATTRLRSGGRPAAG